MKQAYCIFFALLIVCISGGQVLAQGKSRIGKAAEVSQLYKSKANLKQSQRSASHEVRHQLPGNKSISLSISKSKTEKDGEIFYGKVSNVPNSNFFLKVLGNRVTGDVIMPDQKRYYRFTTELNGDVYLQEEDIDKVLCVDFMRHQSVESGRHENSLGAAAIQVPNLESLPGATAVVLLDYDGHYVDGTLWNQVFNGGNPIDALPMNYSESEIEAMWALISADFIAFDVNITTSEEVFNRAPVNRRGRVIFTPTNYFSPGDGGRAYIGSFNFGGDIWGETPSFVWNTGVVNGGNTASHEIGHMLHLLHDGRTSPAEEYYYGNGSWAPIMGAAFIPFAQWSKGDYPFANNTEDDLHIIATRNGFGYRTDDHGDYHEAASAVVIDGTGAVAPASNKGNISNSDDIDVFSFETSGGLVTLQVQPTAEHSNLNPLLVLRSESGQVIRVQDVGQPAVSIEEELQSGRYFLSIEGGTSVYGAYSKYGSLGEYTISGYIPVVTPAVAVDLVSPASGTYFKADASVDLVVALDIPDNTSIQRVVYYQGNKILGTSSKAPYTFHWKGIGKGTYEVYAVAVNQQGETYASDPISIMVVNGYGGGNRNSCELPDWRPDFMYVAGALASLNGNTYEAQRTSTGSNPSQNSHAKGDWKYRGPCRGAIASNKSSSKATAAFSSDDILVYPNPARNRGVLQVELPEVLTTAQVTLQEVGTGARLMESNYRHMSKIPIQLNKLPHGYYVLRIVSENQVWTRKVIINP
ncbi:T9SS type A sorting domain-containing protein [Pontibacter lucknowensis]|uniref:Por secretion system C-terminal sorting domain-containing protein n=1 Tax=Pontibacter lucknowensis TaxID=1077936 RepID=A0A1N6X3Y9_9BACT|nr:T9SS type A sorting domain-containing protein [Pontibacter lucknowensis]SIQ97052.1 Por secretion system C-terminal sorting domain-containing protein [Pontibacter lucknowensis]